MVIFKGKQIPHEWYHDADIYRDAGVHFAATATGWINSDMAMHWLEKCFDRQTRPIAMEYGSIQRPRMLLFDGHGSHLSGDFAFYCNNNNILPVNFPSQATHLLQPCDVGVFSPLAGYYRSLVDQQLRDSQGLLQLRKREFWRAYRVARQKAFTTRTIQSAWMKAGLEPHNPSKVTDKLPKRVETNVVEPAVVAAPMTSTINTRLLRQNIPKMTKEQHLEVTYSLIDEVENIRAAVILLKSQMAAKDCALRDATRPKDQRVLASSRTVEFRGKNTEGVVLDMPYAIKKMNARKDKDAAALVAKETRKRKAEEV
jgi:hypothetical protein